MGRGLFIALQQKKTCVFVIFVCDMGHTVSTPAKSPDESLPLRQELLHKQSLLETRVTDELKKQFQMIDNVQSMVADNEQSIRGIGRSLEPFVEAQKGAQERLDLTNEKADHAITMMAKHALVISAQQDVIEKLSDTIQVLSESLRTTVLAIDNVVPCYAKHRFRCFAMSDMDVSSLDVSERVSLVRYANWPATWKALVAQLTKSIDVDAEINEAFKT